MTKVNKCIKFIIFLLLFYLLVLWSFRKFMAANGGVLYLNFDISILIKIPEYDKYISGNFPYCGGLGNQLFHFTTLYGIGRSINRSPFLQDECSMKEMKSIFPNLQNVKIMNVPKHETKFVSSVNDCCDYRNFSNVDEKYLIFKETVPFRHGFFEKYKNEILYLLKFNPDLIKSAQEVAIKSFKNDTFHKVCVHIRRGEFMKSKYKYQESCADFITNATYQIKGFLAKQGHLNVSLLLMGQDHKFKLNLNIIKLFKNTYYPPLSSRGLNMAFGATQCDTLLLTASDSTFAWWTAYLMPEGKNVFYNSYFLKKGKLLEHEHRKYIPPKWMSINYE